MKSPVFLFFLILAPFLKAQTKDHIVGKYTFNFGKVLNEAGLDQPGLRGVSLVEDRFGNEQSAIHLHGNFNSYINLGTDDILKPRQGSVALWVCVDYLEFKGRGYDYNPIIVTKSHAGNDFFEGYFLGINYYTYKINATVSVDSNTQISINSSHPLTLRKWHHLVMTYDDDSLGFYMDSKLEARLPKNFKNTFLKGDSVIIGHSANKKNARCLCGSVDDILIFDRVISPEQVREIYNARDPNRFHIYLKWFLRIAASLLLLGFTVWLLVRKLRKDLDLQKERSQLNARLNELETQSIRTQMNPHFMFNSLNTLQRFILEEDIENANAYLIRFSNLLRKLLESSSSASTSLNEEIEILKNYIEIEKLRFDKSFEYGIQSSVPNPEGVQIPFMLIQPFVENAIWHGLLPKKDKRSLTITFSDIDKKTLLCIVEDNGVGRKHSLLQRDPFKKKSMAMSFIEQRLDLLGKAVGTPVSFIVIDLEDDRGGSAGTRVEIIIPKMK